MIDALAIAFHLLESMRVVLIISSIRKKANEFPAKHGKQLLKRCATNTKLAVKC